MRGRVKSTLKTRLERNLFSYATAASAAGLGIAGLAQPAEARVVYTPADVRIGNLAHYDLDLNNDGTTDFRIGTSGATHSIDLSVGGISYPQASVQVGKQHSSQANARKIGGEVGPQKVFTPKFAVMARKVSYGSGTSNHVSGSWVNVKGRYLGLKFRIGNKTHYGWARLNLHFGEFLQVYATLTGYAYETTPDRPIVAGDEGTGASLGHLALGAANKGHAPMTPGK